MLCRRYERIGLEHFEAYSFNQPTRQHVLYKSYEGWVFVCSACVGAFRHVYSFDAFDDTDLQSYG